MRPLRVASRRRAVKHSGVDPSDCHCDGICKMVIDDGMNHPSSRKKRQRRRTKRRSCEDDVNGDESDQKKSRGLVTLGSEWTQRHRCRRQQTTHQPPKEPPMNLLARDDIVVVAMSHKTTTPTTPRQAHRIRLRNLCFCSSMGRDRKVVAATITVSSGSR